MSSNAVPVMTPAEFLAHFDRIAAGSGGLRRSRQFVARCLAEAADSGRRASPTVGRFVTTSGVVIDGCMPQPRRVEVVVDEAPTVSGEVVAALDMMEFDLDMVGQRIVGRCGLEPIMALRIGSGPGTRIEFMRYDPVFGWSN